MFSTFKNFFGMDTVKLRLNLLDTYPKNVPTFNGEVELRCDHRQVVTQLAVRLVEVYTRGRGEEKRIDEYEMGRWVCDEPITLTGNDSQVVLFQMPFQFIASNMDDFANKNFVFKGLADIAKTLKGVQSDYQVIAEATVAGGKLQPFVKRKIKFN